MRLRCECIIRPHGRGPQTLASRRLAGRLPRAPRKRNRLLAARRTAQAKITTMKTNLPFMAVRRRQFQHTADGEYPWTDPAKEPDGAQAIRGGRTAADLRLQWPARAGGEDSRCQQAPPRKSRRAPLMVLRRNGPARQSRRMEEEAR